MLSSPCRDLLGKEPQEKLDIKLNPDGSGQLHVPGLTSVEVQGLREIRKVPGDGTKPPMAFGCRRSEGAGHLSYTGRGGS